MAFPGNSLDTQDDTYGGILDLYSNTNPFIVPYPGRMPPQPQEVLLDDAGPKINGVWFRSAHVSSFVGYVQGGFDDDQIENFIQESDPSLYQRLLASSSRCRDVLTRPLSPTKVSLNRLPSVPPLNALMARVQNTSSIKRKAEGLYEEPATDPNLVLLENRLFTGEPRNNLMPRVRPATNQSAMLIDTRLAANTDDTAQLDGAASRIVSRSDLLEAANRLGAHIRRIDKRPTLGTDLLGIAQSSGESVSTGLFAHKPNSAEASSLRAKRQVDTVETLQFIQGVERKREARDLELDNSTDEPTLRIFPPIDRGEPGDIYKKQGLRPSDKWPKRNRQHGSTPSATESEDNPELTTLQRFLNARHEDHENDYESPLPCQCGELEKWEEPMVTCAAEFCHVGAYHLSCAGLDYLPDEGESWYCPNCAEGFNLQPTTTNTDVDRTAAPPTTPTLPQYHHDLTAASSPSPSFSTITQNEVGEENESSYTIPNPTAPPSLTTTLTTTPISLEKITPTTAEFLSQQNHRIVIPDSQDGESDENEVADLGDQHSDIIRVGTAGSVGVDVASQAGEDTCEGCLEEDDKVETGDNNAVGTLRPGVLVGRWA